MKMFLSTVCAATMAIGAIAPLHAAPIQVPLNAPSASADVVQVQSRRELRQERRADRRDRRMDRREDRRERRADRRDDRRDFRRAVRRGNNWYYNGYRGYSSRRSGYREYNGFWFPLAAFAAGAIISNSQPRVVIRSGGSHVEWCHDRYRSYRAWDNSWQPYDGGRKQCYSPYS